MQGETAEDSEFENRVERVDKQELLDFQCADE